MDTSRRAVESYWRSRMIDAATSDEDKVTPVYKLEEICELLRSSPAGIVKEVSEFLLKRLDHKSPVVKQKALRVIKYSVGKSGPEFRREMQRNSVAVKQLLHYKGQPDPLKGDALNKAVRETAQDALSAIFSTDDDKPAATKVTHKRMEGFGNTNFVRPPDEKKSFLSEVVDIGSSSIKQGLSNLAQAHSQSFKKNDIGSYRGPTLNKSLTNDSERYEKMGYHGGSQGSSSSSRNSTAGPWGQDSRTVTAETTGVDSNSSYTESKTREERLLETIVTSGGMRLQPTRDALQAFLMEGSKMDALALSRALESKLQSPHWQVRVKAVCVLEAILRKKDDEHFSIIASYFADRIDLVIKCSESPQSSLREKANRVLSLLGGDKNGYTSEKATKVEKVEMPDLIDTGYDDLLGQDLKNNHNDQPSSNNQLPSSLLIDDLFGDAANNDLSKTELRNEDDPFADVSFHTSEDKDPSNDLFAGMTTVGKDSGSAEVPRSDTLDPFDIFGSSEPVQTQEIHANDVNNAMASLSIGGSGSMTSENKTNTTPIPGSIFSDSNLNPSSQDLNNVLSGFDTQKATPTTNSMFPMGPIPYNIPPGMLLNQYYPAATANANPMFPMGGLLAPQQFMAAMANFQTLSNLNSHNVSGGNAAATLGGSVSPIPDIFNANMPAQTSTATMNTPKEDTKAFDFITDHLAQARDTKRVI
ncbi:protein MODIFIED TRANSPORT TO THE VACUOLE 1-like [Amaranthus tricolor]|uniref:protein MODIFIED TRANSPORT TO THE VACUOLE 1-like n=1 Tax=Amaranthus tricolor TaxID=29722 RepID=UPI00258FBC29|nr:protein MODIFIED TRANSPORT TO THE VACUOLE 1-like [Amaranthus tricolor]